MLMLCFVCREMNGLVMGGSVNVGVRGGGRCGGVKGVGGVSRQGEDDQLVGSSVGQELPLVAEDVDDVRCQDGADSGGPIAARTDGGATSLKRVPLKLLRLSWLGWQAALIFPFHGWAALAVLDFLHMMMPGL